MDLFFSIHNLAIAADRRRAAVDLLPRDFLLLHQGTRELMQHLAAEIGLQGVVTNWTVRHLCSPYFATKEDASSVEELYPQFFRVELTFGDAIPDVNLEPFKTWSTDERDDTWYPPESGANLSWTELDCIVIADFIGTRPAEGAGHELVDLGDGVTQLRMEVGRVSNDHGREHVSERVRELARVASSMNWRISRTRYLQRSR